MRKTSKMTIAVVALAALALVAAACSNSSDEEPTMASETTASMAPSEPGTSSMTITEIVADNPDFSTLLAAVQAAGLEDTLSGEGPYTVFAPTDEAFAALPEGTLDTLLEPKNKEQLASILTYHVVPGEVMAADVQPGKVTTVNGDTFTISTDGGEVTITDGEGNTALVTATDITASNGVIHVIDAVLMPPAN
jgi:uncharacterized surface protein with fasciclin (FAS1) repeats